MLYNEFNELSVKDKKEVYKDLNYLKKLAEYRYNESKLIYSKNK